MMMGIEAPAAPAPASHGGTNKPTRKFKVQAPSFCPTVHSRGQIRAQHRIQLLVGADGDEIDLVVAAAAFHFVTESDVLLQVALAQGPRVADQLLPAFVALELRHAVKRKARLEVVKNLEHDDFVAQIAEVLQA